MTRCYESNNSVKHLRFAPLSRVVAAAALTLASAASLFGLAAGSGCASLKNADTPGEGGPNGGDEAATSDEAAGGDDGGGGDGGTGEGGTTGTVCTAATCTVEVVEQGLYGPVSIAVDGTHLYWLEVGDIPPGNSGELARIAKSSGCKKSSCFDVLDPFVLSGQLAGQNIYEAHIALGVNDVCYTQSFNTNPEHSIACFSLASPTLAKRALDDGPGAVLNLWIGGSQARWAIDSSSPGAADALVAGRPLSGGATSTLAGGRVGVTSVTSDGAKVYWSEYGAGAAMGSVEALAGDAGAPLAKNQQAPIAVHIFGQYLYWIEAGKRTVMRARSDGSGSPEQIATTDVNPVDLVVDASGVYWIASGPGMSGIAGTLSHAPLTPGGDVTIMIKDINIVYALAADTTHVYVASVGQMIADGQIVRIPKTH